MNQSQLTRRYIKEFMTAMTAYVIALIASVMVLNNIELPQIARVVVVLLPIIPVIFVIIAILRALSNSDELIQRIQLQAVVFSAITTGLITFTYGFLENIGFPPFPTIWILPMMFFLWGIGRAFFDRRYQ